MPPRGAERGELKVGRPVLYSRVPRYYCCVIIHIRFHALIVYLDHEEPDITEKYLQIIQLFLMSCQTCQPRRTHA